MKMFKLGKNKYFQKEVMSCSWEEFIKLSRSFPNEREIIGEKKKLKYIEDSAIHFLSEARLPTTPKVFTKNGEIVENYERRVGYKVQDLKSYVLGQGYTYDSIEFLSAKLIGLMNSIKESGNLYLAIELGEAWMEFKTRCKLSSINQNNSSIPKENPWPALADHIKRQYPNSSLGQKIHRIKVDFKEGKHIGEYEFYIDGDRLCESGVGKSISLNTFKTDYLSNRKNKKKVLG